MITALVVTPAQRRIRGSPPRGAVALIAGGHAFGKSHGLIPFEEIGAPPEMAPMEAMGLGRHNPQSAGKGRDSMSNGIEGSWTPNPI